VPTGDSLPKRFTIGKLPGLQQISYETGIFAMCAMDHRGSMQRMISGAETKKSRMKCWRYTIGGGPNWLWTFW
jgi:hypothetical protein